MHVAKNASIQTRYSSIFVFICHIPLLVIPFCTKFISNIIIQISCEGKECCVCSPMHFVFKMPTPCYLSSTSLWWWSCRFSYTVVSSIFEGIHFRGFRKIPFREYIYLWTVVLTMSSVVTDLISIRIWFHGYTWHQNPWKSVFNKYWWNQIICFTLLLLAYLFIVLSFLPDKQITWSYIWYLFEKEKSCAWFPK